MKQKLTLFVAVVSGFSVLSTSITISTIGMCNLYEGIREKLDISAKMVGDYNRAAIAFINEPSATANLDAAFNINPAIRLACLYDQNGKLFAVYQANHDNKMQTCPSEAQNVPPPSRLHDIITVMRQIRKDESLVGYIYLASDLREIDSYVSKQVTTAMWVSAVVSAIAFLLAISLQRGIFLPILRLADVARKVTDDQDFTVRAPTQEGEDKNEINILSSAFNVMLEEIHGIATTDELTGLHNRHYFNNHLGIALCHAANDGGSLWVMTIDMDHFKEVNDTHGHAAGDEVLKCLARIITRSCRVGDLAARYGGEEFVVMMAGIDLHEARNIAERFRHKVENMRVELANGAEILNKTVSIGMADLNLGDSVTTLLKRADDALYKAKNSGRNKVIMAKTSISH